MGPFRGLGVEETDPRRLFTADSSRLPILARPRVRRYWLDLKSHERPPRDRVRPAPEGIGISAFDREDALRMLTAFSLFANQPIPVPAELEEDIDPSDARFVFFHRLGLFGVPIWRGIWCPRPSSGYIWSPVLLP